MRSALIYNLSGELDDISHLFPNERLGRIASILQGHGIPATIIDQANHHDLQRLGPEYLKSLGELEFGGTNSQHAAVVAAEAKAILTRGVDTIFLNLWHGAGFTFSIALAQHLRSLAPELTIIGVRQKVDWFKAHILRLAPGALDGLITGLGYDAVDFLAKGGAPANCPNIIWAATEPPRENRSAPLDVETFPLASYTADIYTNITEKVPLHTITLSNQACPNRCVFCIRPENYGRINVKRDIQSVLQELRSLRHDHGIRHVRVEDSTPPAGALTELATAILGSDLRGDMAFSAFARMDTNRDEDFSLLHEAGFLALFLGIASLDDSNLKRIRKGIRYEDICRTLRAAHAAGLKTVGSFIFPLPGETEKTMQTTLCRLREIRGDLDSLLVLPAGIYPDTPWGDAPEDHGVFLEENFVEAFITYPLKYLQPIHLWPPVPFTYSIMGRPAKDVPFTDILKLYAEFTEVARQELGLPAVPDYYYLLADMMGMPPTDATRKLIQLMVARDYAGIRNCFR